MREQKKSFKEYVFPTITFNCIKMHRPPNEHIPAINGIVLNDFDESSEIFDISNKDFINVKISSDKPICFIKLNMLSELSKDIKTAKNKIVVQIVNKDLPVDITAWIILLELKTIFSFVSMYVGLNILHITIPINKLDIKTDRKIITPIFVLLYIVNPITPVKKAGPPP